MSDRTSVRADLSVGEHQLKLDTFTAEQELFRKRITAYATYKYVPEHDRQDVLEMLGVLDYAPGRPPKKWTPILHGTRGGYANRGCGRAGSPPCPATPSCADKNNEYFRDYRAGQSTPERISA